MKKEDIIELKKECNMCTKKWTRSRRKKFTELLQRKIKENKGE